MGKENKFTILENFITTLMYGVGIVSCSLIILLVFKLMPNKVYLSIITSVCTGAVLVAWAFIKLNIDVRKKREEGQK